MNLRHAVLPLLLGAALPSFDAAAARGFEVRDLAALDRVSAPTLSPNGRTLVFAKRVADLPANKSSTALWIEDLFARDAAPPKRLTPDGWNVNSPSFSTDGSTVYFLSAKSGSMQLYAIPTRGGEPARLTDFPSDIGSYKLSPDGKRLAFSVEAFADCGSDLACSPKRMDERGKQKNSGVLFDRIFIRHWDAWNDGRLNRLFVTGLGDGKAMANTGTLVGADVIGDVPSRPFGDQSEYEWSPDGKQLVLSARKADQNEPHSTNFDLYLVNADGSGTAKNLTTANPAWDTTPVFSPGWQEAVLPRHEAPRFRSGSLRADGDGPGLRHGARDRAALGRIGQWHHLVDGRQEHLHDRAGTRAGAAVRRGDRQW
jgi:dipeptidyl aminopeptidase/acylaminoacyl peptidase